MDLLNDLDRLSLQVSFERLEKLKLQKQLLETQLVQVNQYHDLVVDEQKKLVERINNEYKIQPGDKVELETGQIMRVEK